jgi:hypothetical protein
MGIALPAPASDFSFFVIIEIDKRGYITKRQMLARVPLSPLFSRTPICGNCARNRSQDCGSDDGRDNRASELH